MTTGNQVFDCIIQIIVVWFEYKVLLKMEGMKAPGWVGHQE